MAMIDQMVKVSYHLLTFTFFKIENYVVIIINNLTVHLFSQILRSKGCIDYYFIIFPGNEWIKQLLTLIGPKTKSKRSWFKRTESSQDDWDKVRNNIWSNMQARDVLEDICYVCKEQTAKIYCLDCIHSLCPLCDNAVHEKEPCHDRMVDGKILSPTDGLTHDNEIIFSGIIVQP